MTSNTIDFILLIPCYNNQKGLLESIKSVQYAADKFEILIIDDGSSTLVSIDALKNNNPQFTIQLIRINQNQGILNALNTGLELLKTRTDYKYIARLDAGDSCYPERFTKQVQFLDNHADIFLLGTWCRFENTETGKGYDYITKVAHDDILKEMHFKCSFIHPTVMFRKEVLDVIGLYPDYPYTEDYAYFWKILKKFNGAILPEVLVKISASEKNISSKNYSEQLRSRKKIVAEFGDVFILKFFSLLLLNFKIIMPKKFISFLKFGRN
jgi:glycosyltransferase involved in cell wall biosynthesis